MKTRVQDLPSEPNYAIDDADSNRLTAGLQEHNVWQVAQRIANKRGESVYVYETGGNDDNAQVTEVAPEAN